MSRDKENGDEDPETEDDEGNKTRDSETTPKINIEDDDVFIPNSKRDKMSSQDDSQSSSKEFLTLPEEHNCSAIYSNSDSEPSVKQKPNHRDVTGCSRFESLSSSNSSWSSLSSSKQPSHCIVTDV